MFQRAFDAAELLPELKAHPRVTLGQGPTPLELLPTLGEKLGITLWTKRDDCNGLAFGGNKVRQLEYYFGRAQAAGADTVLITGALQSNFVRLAAAAACRMGWRAEVQLEERVAKNDPLYRANGNVLLDHLFGAGIHFFPEGENERAADRNLDRIAERLAAQGRKPYVIHLGMDHPPYGALGYAAAAAETWSQLRELDEEATHVVLASGSGLTHAGFLAGARALEWDIPVAGICVRRSAELQRPRVEQRAEEVAALLGRESLIGPEDVDVDDGVLAPGYGHLNDETLAAIRLGARCEGLLLDPVYTGRCLAGLIRQVESGRIPQGARVVFLHTGGTPALFAYQRDLEPALMDAAAGRP